MTIARQVAGGVQTASAQDAALDLLARHPEGLTVAEIAEQLRLHVTTVRVHLNRLVAEERLLQRDERVGVGRPRRRYFPVPRAVPSATIQDDYQMLTEVLAQVLDVESTKAEDVLKEWVMRTLDAGILGLPKPSEAGWQDKVDVVLGLLRSWGYDPRVTVWLRSCAVAHSARPLSRAPRPCVAHTRGSSAGRLGCSGKPTRTSNSKQTSRADPAA